MRMGQGEEVKIKSDPKVEIQEKGEIFFFYRPRVNKDEAHSADDVQRLYIVLCPESGERPLEEKQNSESGKEGMKISEEKEEENNDKETKKADEVKAVKGKHALGSEGGRGSEEVNIEKQPLLRFIIMGRKSLPDPSKRSRPYWGFVEMVTTKVDDIKTALKGEEYDTATRGHRRTSPARALGEGVYRILRHQPSPNKTHTHLIYKLEPNKDNEPQKSLHIEREASFIIQIKNPNKGRSSDSGFRGLQAKRKALFPASLQGRFGSKGYGPADPPDFLNYEGCEFLLISASDDLEEELGLELKGEVDESRADKSCSDLIQMFGEAGSAKPLLSGTWV